MPHKKLSLVTRQQSGRTRMDDEIMWRIGATLFVYRRQSTVDGRIVALLTSRHSGSDVGANGILRCK